MAQFKDYQFNNLIGHEGEVYTDDPNDPGGPTKLGITLDTWRQFGKDIDKDGDIDKDDVKLITKPMAYEIYKKEYWDCFELDLLKNQSVADIIFDHGVNAGRYRTARMVQKILKDNFKCDVIQDGKIGINTLLALDSVDQLSFFKAFVQLRIFYYTRRIGELPNYHPLIPFFNDLKLTPSSKAKIYKNGWLRRVNSFVFKA